MSAVGESAGLFRRLGALFYDVLLLAAILMLVTALLLLFTGGEAIVPQSSGGLEPFYQLILFLVIVLYFGFFWTRSGQTLGMRAWRIRLLRATGERLRWRDVFARLAAALLSWLPAGLGYWWLLVDRGRLAWHDRLSRTRVVLTSSY